MPMRLRLYHHPDGTRVAYRQAGTGPPLGLVHSGLLSHMEWEPSVEQLSAHFRVVLPDLPLHGDSEDSPDHPYTLDWFADVLAGFAADVLGSRPAIGGHGAGAEIVMHAAATGRIRPDRLVVMPNRLHAPPQAARRRSVWRAAAMAGAVPGFDRLAGYAARSLFKPEFGIHLSERGNPAARNLLRHALADVPGNADLARAWARCARAWPAGARPELWELYPRLRMPVLLLWADRDRLNPLGPAEEALRMLPYGQLRILESAGFLMAYDDPVGLARELVAFCG
jgi:pimeloyl-ACP methyl ester carboxylesterase